MTRFDEPRSIQSALRESKVSPMYLAGFFDADGYVSGGQSGREHPCGIERTSFQMGVRTTVKHQPMMFKEEYGGSLTKEEKAAQTHADVWGWSVVGKSAIRPLEDLIPYLREKKEQAKIMLQQVKKNDASHITTERRAKERLEASKKMYKLKDSNRRRLELDQ